MSEQPSSKQVVLNPYDAWAEIQRLRAGLQLIAIDEHRLMNVTARQTAQSILDGKPIHADEPTAAQCPHGFSKDHCYKCDPLSVLPHDINCTCQKCIRAKEPCDGCAQGWPINDGGYHQSFGQPLSRCKRLPSKTSDGQ